MGKAGNLSNLLWQEIKLVLLSKFSIAWWKLTSVLDIFESMKCILSTTKTLANITLSMMKVFFPYQFRLLKKQKLKPCLTVWLTWFLVMMLSLFAVSFLASFFIFMVFLMVSLFVWAALFWFMIFVEFGILLIISAIVIFIERKQQS